MYSFRHIAGALIATALFALAGMSLNCLVVDSVTFTPMMPTTGAIVPHVKAPPYMTELYMPQKITVDLFYRGYGSTVLDLKPYGAAGACFKNGFRLNGIEQNFSGHPKRKGLRCGDFRFDFGDMLKQGHNTLELINLPGGTHERYALLIGLTIGTPLLGSEPVLKVLTLIFAGCLLALGWLLLRRQGFDRPACTIFIAACALYLAGLYGTTNFRFSMDSSRHLGYMAFVSSHFWQTYDYQGPENWNTPLYYWICALIAKAVAWVGSFDVFLGIRTLSLACYIGMLYYGMRTFAYCLQGSAFYLALSLLALWPSSIFCSGWIYGDVLMYPFYAACFYYTLVWHRTAEVRALVLALVSCSIAFMAKTAAIVPAAVLGSCILLHLATGRNTLRSLLTKEYRPGWIALAAGLVINQGRYLYHHLYLRNPIPFSNSWGGGWGHYKMRAENILTLDIADLLQHTGQSKSLWNFQISSTLYTTHHWAISELASCLIIFYLLMLVYIGVFTLTMPRRKCAEHFPLLAGLVLPLLASVAFVLACRMDWGIIFRYVEPALIAIVLLFVLAVQETRLKGWRVLYYGGNVIGILFIIFSVAFFQLPGLQLSWPVLP